MEKNTSIESIDKIKTHPVFKKIIAEMKDSDNKTSNSSNLIKLSKLDLEKEVKIPYIIKDKILMSPGVWNGFFYSPEEIVKAFEETDWEDKDVRSIYLDHMDGSNQKMGSLTWVGEVLNMKIVDENLIADLVIVDKPTAIKLAYGAKMGISPKVHGGDEEGQMTNFLYDNFSVVINPAVKTAYINNSQIEKKTIKNKFSNKKPYGDVIYADTGFQKDGISRFPLDTKKHIESAWNYINVPRNQKFYSKDQVKKIKTKIEKSGKRFGIDFSKKINLSENDKSRLTGAIAPEYKYNDTYLTMLNYSNEHNELIPEELFYQSLNSVNTKYEIDYYVDAVDSVDHKIVTTKNNQEENKMTDEQVPNGESEQIQTEDVKEEVKVVAESTESTEAEATEVIDDVKEEPAQVSNEMSSIVSMLEEIKSSISKNSDAIKEMQEKPKVEDNFKKPKEDEKGDKDAKDVKKEDTKEMKEEVKEDKKDDEDKKVEKSMSQESKDSRDVLIQEMSDKINQLESKINEPDRATVKTVEMSQDEFVNQDEAFLEHLRSLN